MNAPFTPQLPSQAYLVLWTGKHFEGIATDRCDTREEVRAFIEEYCTAGGWSVYQIGHDEMCRPVTDDFTFEEVEDSEEAEYAAAARHARFERSMSTHNARGM